MIDAFLKGITLGLWLSISVGPILFSVIKQSLNNGHKGGMAFVLGISVSDITLVFLSNIFSQLVTELITHKMTIGIAGSIFLISMGVYFFFFKKIKVTEDGKLGVINFRKRDYARLALAGFLMNILNPGIFVFWLTVSTTLVNNTLQEKIIMFTVCLVFVLATDIAKVMLAGKIRKKLTPHNIHIISRINGLILIGFGIALIWGLIHYADKLK
jgi:threonine/homoserine/homoserine lactone efflux protein